MKAIRLVIPILLAAFAVSCSKDPVLPQKKEEEEKKEEETKKHETPTDPAAIYGYVKDKSGNPVADAVVSDGYGCTKTGSDGYYCLTSPKPARAKFVFVSVPAGYEPLTEFGIPQFYTKLATLSSKPRYADITIRKMTQSQNEFYFIFTADPQARSTSKSWKEKVAFPSIQAYEDMFDDQAEYVATLGGKPCYGIALGDICWNDPTVYTQYAAGMKKIGIPFYGTIGNHDHQATDKKDDDACAAEYEAVFGPRNFSVNIGSIHVISLDDLYFQADAGTGLCVNNTYNTYIEDDFLEWIKEDIKYVPKSTPVFICVHSPIIGEAGLSMTIHNAQALGQALEGRKVYFWAGHVHHSRCFTYDASSTDGRYECHTLFRTTGPLYINEYVCGDGTPRGYVVMHVEGTKISWKYKPTSILNAQYAGNVPNFKWRDWHYESGRAIMNDGSGVLDSRYQIRAYNRGDYDDDFIYANVFMWDNSWSVPTVTIDGKTSVMKQVHFYDQTYKEVVNEVFRKSRFAQEGEEFEYADNSQFHHFNFRVPDDAKGNTTVSVKDRFGNTYSYTVSANPKVYTDGNLHLKFAFDVNNIGLPTSITTNVAIKYPVDGTTYNFTLARGYFNTENEYLAISGKNKSLKLPAISGYKLVGVTARTSNNSKTARYALVSSDAAGANVVSGGEQMMFCGDCSDSWTLYSTGSNTSYYLTCMGGGFPLAELRLTYQKD